MSERMCASDYLTTFLLTRGNGYAGLRLRTTRRTKGSAHIAHAYSHQVLTELKTFLFYHSTFLTGGTDASRARLRDVHFLALCSS